MIVYHSVDSNLGVEKKEGLAEKEVGVLEVVLPGREQKLAWKLIKFLMSFFKPPVSFSLNTRLWLFSSNIIYFNQGECIKVQILRFSSVWSKFVAFSSKILYALDKRRPLKCKFSDFPLLAWKWCQIPFVIFQATCQFSSKFCIIYQCHET